MTVSASTVSLLNVTVTLYGIIELESSHTSHTLRCDESLFALFMIMKANSKSYSYSIKHYFPKTSDYLQLSVYFGYEAPTRCFARRRTEI